MSTPVKDVIYEIEDKYLSPYAFKREDAFSSKNVKSARNFSATATELYIAKRSED